MNRCVGIDIDTNINIDINSKKLDSVKILILISIFKLIEKLTTIYYNSSSVNSNFDITVDININITTLSIVATYLCQYWYLQECYH